MSNLLEETIEILGENGKNEKDVRWVSVCSGDQYGFENDGMIVALSWESFKSKANREYDDGFGRSEVKSSLQVVGSDFWLERHEYDGSEWWEFKEMPKMPTDFLETVKIFEGDHENV